MSDFGIKGSSFQPINITKVPEGKTNLFKEAAKDDGSDNVFVKMDNGDQFIATGLANLVTKPIKEGAEVNFNGQKGVVSFVDNEINTQDEKSVVRATKLAKNMSSPATHIWSGVGGGVVGGITYLASHNAKASIIAGTSVTAGVEGIVALSSLGTNFKKHPDTESVNSLGSLSPESLKQFEQSKYYQSLLSAERGSSISAKEDFNMIKESLRKGEDLGDAIKTYIDLLSAERGSTTNAEDAFREIDSRIRPTETRESVTQTYIDLLSAERGSSYDALTDFRLIDSRLSTNEKREFATKTFIDLLSSERGSSTQARDAYKMSTKE